MRMPFLTLGSTVCREGARVQEVFHRLTSVFTCLVSESKPVSAASHTCGWGPALSFWLSHSYVNKALYHLFWFLVLHGLIRARGREGGRPDACMCRHARINLQQLLAGLWRYNRYRQMSLTLLYRLYAVLAGCQSVVIYGLLLSTNHIPPRARYPRQRGNLTTIQANSQPRTREDMIPPA